MIKLVNAEGREVEVTKGAYKSLYEPLGYSIKNEDKSHDMKSAKSGFKAKETEAKDFKDKVDE